jgi:hypothetical protein
MARLDLRGGVAASPGQTTQALRYVAADGRTVTDAAMTSGSNQVTSASAAFTSGDVNKLIAVIGAGAAGVNLQGWIGSVSNGVASVVTTKGGSTPVNAGTTVAGVEASFATDDTSGLQAAVDAAAHGTLFIPDLGVRHIGIAGTISSSQPISIAGDAIRELYGGAGAGNDANWPSVAPYFEGAVICQYAASTDVLNLTAQGRSQNLRRLGIRFAASFINTGHAVVNSIGGTGLSNIGGVFEDVKVHGHDGSHYAFVLDAPEICRYSGLRSYGGGFLWLKAPNAPGQPGNADFYNCVGSLFVGGSAHGVFFDGTAHTWNACIFSNLQQGVRVPAPAISGTAPPTNAQHPIHTTGTLTNWTNIGFDQPGWESDVAGNNSTLPTGAGCYRTNDSFAPVGNPAMNGNPTNGAGNLASAVGIQNQVGKPITVYQEFMLHPAAGSNATTLTAASAAGATTINFATTGYAQGDVVTIDTGALQEVAIIASIVSGTQATVVGGGSWGLAYAHASGVAINKGGAMVLAQMHPSNSWPGQWRRARAALPAGAGPQLVSFAFPVPPSYWYRLDWKNADRVWTDYPATFG